MIEQVLEANRQAIEAKRTTKLHDTNVLTVYFTCMDGRCDLDNDFEGQDYAQKFNRIWLGSAGCQLLHGKPTNEELEKFFQPYFRTALVRNQIMEIVLESHSHKPNDPLQGCDVYKCDTKAALKTTYTVAGKLSRLFPQTNVYRIHRYTYSSGGFLTLASDVPEGLTLPEDQHRFDPSHFEDMPLSNTLGIARDNHDETIITFTNVTWAFPRIGYNSLKCSYPVTEADFERIVLHALEVVFTNALKDSTLPCILHFDAAYGQFNFSSWDNARIFLEQVKNVIKAFGPLKCKKKTIQELVQEGAIKMLYTITNDRTFETERIIA
jgi:hypothetical protein